MKIILEGATCVGAQQKKKKQQAIDLGVILKGEWVSLKNNNNKKKKVRVEFEWRKINK